MKQNNKKKNWLRLFRFMFIFLGCWVIAFDYNISENGFHWFWKGKEQMAFIFGLLSIIFGILWKLEQRKENIIEN